jgi:hypothetical protein
MEFVVIGVCSFGCDLEGRDKAVKDRFQQLERIIDLTMAKAEPPNVIPVHVPGPLP